MRIQSCAAPVVCFAAILSSGALALAPVGGCASSDTQGFSDGGTDDTGTGVGSSSSSSNPFGTSSSTSNPFGGSTSETSSTTSNPFGGSSSSTTNPGGSTSTSQSSSSSTSGGACNATDSGGLALMSNYLAPSVIAEGGYGFAYDDMVASTACALSTALCGAGTTGVATTTPPIVWGAGLGFNLNQAMATGSMSPPVDAYAIPTTTTGITYALSSLSGTMRIVLTTSDMPDGYGYTLTAASGTVPWASFNTTPWAPSTGVALTGAPQNAQAIEFEVVAGAAATSFNFCVTSVSFAQ